LCLALPETSETASWAHPNFRAGRKTFCAFEIIQKRPSIAFRLSAADVKAVLASRNAFSTPYGRGVWVSLWIDVRIDWPRIAALVERSYRTVASRRMLAALEPRTQNPEPRTSNLNTNPEPRTQK